MNYNALLELTSDIGYRLAMCGAETFRIEESILRIFQAYGIAAEVFAIPNCLHVSIETPNKQLLTRMRRIGFHGNDLDSVEKYNSLCRRICAETPSTDDALVWLAETEKIRRTYSLPLLLFGSALGALGFSILFGGVLIDCICAAVCGFLVGLVTHFTGKWKVNQFFSTIAAAFILALVSYGFGAVGIAKHTDSVVIGTLMLLVPGLVFTNAMRDIIFGDTNSGVNRIVQVFLVAAAIALGTGAGWNLSCLIWGTPLDTVAPMHSIWMQCIAAFVGCYGFSILFNIHGPGGLLCALGGMLSWLTYCIAQELGADVATGYFAAALIAAVYSETMARIRKYPAISYLVMSIFPLIPGAGVYYTTNYLVRGDGQGFADKGMETVAVAGAIAVGLIMVSTIVRLINIKKQK